MEQATKATAVAEENMIEKKQKYKKKIAELWAVLQNARSELN